MNHVREITVLGEIGEIVYLFHAEGTDLFKIGRTKDVNARKNQLQTGCPHRLTLVGTLEGDAVQIERDLHLMFADYRRTGEWFEVSEQFSIRRLFRSNEERDVGAIQFLIFSATQIRVSIYTGTFYDQHQKNYVLKYQLMPDDDMHPFWKHLLSVGEQQFHPSAIQAAAAWVDAFNNWPERSAWLKKIGDTYHCSQSVLKKGIECPNCRWPIRMS